MTTTYSANGPGPAPRPMDPSRMEPVPSMLLVDDDPASVQVLGRMLAGLGQVRFACSGVDALTSLRAASPDLVLLDAEMPGMSGFQFCAQLKADPVLAEIPVIFITSHGDSDTEVAGFAAGAVDFIRKPPVPQVVQARVRTQLQLKSLSDALRCAAFSDGLTGVSNRRRFDEELNSECNRARRSGAALSMLMVDVDQFKSYNDRYGHVAGDDCLRRVAKALKSVAQRPTDRVARYGGEEFALLLPHTEVEGAARLAQRTVDAVADLHIPHIDSALGQVVTVSVGASSARRTADGWHTQLSAVALVSAADSALYAAKAAGRGRCCVFGHAPERASRSPSA